MKFNISHEGVIYATNPDGTVTKYGRIGSDGQLTDAFGRPLAAAGPKAPVRRRPVWGYWLVILLLLLAGGVGTYVFMRQTEEKDSLAAELREARVKAGTDAGMLKSKEQLIEKLQKELEAINRSRFEAEKNLSEIGAQASAVTPLLVSGIEFRNMNRYGKPLGNFGAPLRVSTLRFLQARISYYGLTTGMKTFRVRIVGPEGVMGGGEWSFAAERPVESGASHEFTLSGFGYPDRLWPSGHYRYELWYGKSLIGLRRFTL